MAEPIVPPEHELADVHPEKHDAGELDDTRVSWLPPYGLALTAGTIVGLVILIPFAAQVHPSWSVLSASGMFAVASVAAGGLLGLLFGVPRSIGSGQPTNDAKAQPLTGIAANTNLEQISDWLTKIIVGVSLTQLFTIKRGGMHLFNAMAPSLGGGSQAAAFAGAEVVYFSILGFFVGWFYARLRLGALMSNADAYLSLARRATKARSPATAARAKEAATANVDALLALSRRASSATDTAQVAKDAAKATIAAFAGTGTAVQLPPSPADLAGRYNQLRASLVSGPARTGQLEDLVRQARWLTRDQRFTAQDVHDMFHTSDDGSRVIALGIMQGDLGCADLESVLSAITSPRSGFEQYHALKVADQLGPSLNLRDQVQLIAALQGPAVQQLSSTSSRRVIADRILVRLTGSSAGGGEEDAKTETQRAVPVSDEENTGSELMAAGNQEPSTSEEH